MPKTKAQKAVIIDELAERFGKMKSAVFASANGFTMKDADMLRAKTRAQGADVFIAKKTLLLKALQQSGLSMSKEVLDGSILTVVGYQDEVAPAKIMSDFLKTKESMKVVGGILEHKLVDATAVKTLSKLPGKQELYAKLVGSLNAPVSGFVNVLGGNLRNVVSVLNNIAQAKAKA